MTSGLSSHSHSTASVDYTKDDQSIEVEIVDSAFSQMALLPFQFLMGAGYAKESGDGYEKSLKVAGQPAMEKWDKQARRAELTVLVGARYIVTIKADQVDNASIAHDVAGKLDLGKLAGMK